MDRETVPTCGRTQIKLQEIRIQHEFVVPAKILNTWKRGFTSPWISDSAVNHHHFRIGASPSPCTAHILADEAECNHLWLQFATTEEVQQVGVLAESCSSDSNPDAVDGNCLSSFHTIFSELKLHTSDDETHKFLWDSAPFSDVHTLRRYEYRGPCVLNVLSENVKIDVTVIVERPVVVAYSSPVRRRPSVHAKEVLRQMLSGEVFPDVKLDLEDGTTLWTHRAVLAVNSVTFKNVLQQYDYTATGDDSTNRQTATVEVVGFRAEVVGAALRFLYGDEDVTVDEGPVLCAELLALAERYQFVALKAACEETLAQAVAAEALGALGALDLLLHADTHRAVTLRTAILRCLAADPNRKNFFDDDALKRIAESHQNLFPDLVKALL